MQSDRRFWLRDGVRKSGRLEWLRGHLPASDFSLLDLGCTGGVAGSADTGFSAKIRELPRLVRYVGIDKICEPGSERNGMVETVQHDLNAEFPMDSTTFDVIYCGQIFEHLENPHFTLRECFRVLVPQGTIVVDVPNSYGVYPLLRWLLFGVDDLGDPTHIRLMTPGCWLKSLRDTGFTDIAYGFDFKYPTHIRLVPFLNRTHLGNHFLISAKRQA